MGARILCTGGPQAACTLLFYIDDPTSELMQLKMVESESTFAYMDATREYIERQGKPVAFSSDKCGLFQGEFCRSLFLSQCRPLFIHHGI